MRNKKKFLWLILFAFLGFSVFAQEKDVALITLNMKRITFGELLDLTPETRKALIAVTQDEANFTFGPFMAQVHNALFTEPSSLMPFTLLPEESVINNPEYKAFDRGHDSTTLKYFYIAEGYKYHIYEAGANLGEDRTVNRLLDIFKDAEGIMMISIYYNMKKYLPVTVGIHATAYISIYNRRGYCIYSEEFRGESKESLPYISGVVPGNPNGARLAFA